MHKFIKHIFVLSIMLIIVSSLSGAYLRFEPVELNQPDGSKLNLFATGDEFYNWLHDKDGFTIKQNDKGWYVYLDKKSENELICTNLIVGRDNPKTLNLSPWTNISPNKMGEIRKQVQREMRLSESGRAPTSGTLNNLVVFIRFSDQPEFNQSLTTYSSLFNGISGNTMQSYFKEVSYDQLNVNTSFYPTPTSMVVSWQDTEHSRSYYMPYNASTNPGGYLDSERTAREHNLLVNAVNGISTQVPAGLNLDGDNDGKVDNVCFIIQGATTAWATLLWPHRWTLYSQNVSINGKRVYDYNFQLSNSIASSGNGVLCHEMFHSLGAPDLYHYTSNGISPVGAWDLMESNSNPPEHMCAFMKYKYGHWISEIPVLANAGSYSINSLISADNNCYRINSPNSSSEYFVVEFRKKTGQFENSLPGTGMLIYRIKTDCGNGNADGPPDEVYLYRLNGTPSVNGTISSAAFSIETGRTSFNDNTNPSCFLSTGDNGNISLSAIGSSGGASISFSLNYIPPQNLNAIASHAKVSLSWQVPGYFIPNSYKLYRNGILLTTLTGLEYNDTDVTNGTSYNYYVKAVFTNPAGESEASNTVFATPSALQPQSLSGTAGDAICTLTWQAPISGTPTGYKIYRNSVLKATTTGLSFVDNSVVNNTYYSYYVTAIYANPIAESVASNSVSLTPVDDLILTIGSGNLNQGLPMTTANQYSYSQSIYLQSEINYPSKSITKLYWYYAGGAVYTDNIRIYMGHTNLNAFPSATSWVPLTSLTCVYDGTITTTSSAGWIVLNLSSPFIYNNIQNLVIALDENNPGFQSSYFFNSSVTGNRSLLYKNDTLNPDPASPPNGLLRAYIPNIKLYLVSVFVPYINVSPANLNFGEVSIGGTCQLISQIQNTGNAYLTGNITTPTGFSIIQARDAEGRNSMGYSIAPGQSENFQITFLPSINQPYNGSITITSNDPFKPLSYIELTGIGVVPPNLELSTIYMTEYLTSNSSSVQTLSLLNTGGGQLNYSIQITDPPLNMESQRTDRFVSQTDRNITWLTCSSQSGTIAAGNSHVLDIGFNAAGLLPGLHSAVINISSNDPAHPILTVTIDLNVTISSPVAHISRNGYNLQISWNPVPGANNYKIYRCCSYDGVYQFIESVTQTVFTESNVLDCAFYKVIAVFE